LKTIVVGNRTVTPSKIICVGRNYVAHIEELGNRMPDEMVVFMKPNSAISDDLQATHIEQLHYEGELSFVFEGGRFSAVGFGIDLTRRELQSRLKEKGLPWERAKAFDGSAVFSEFAEIGDDIDSLSMQLEINGREVQVGTIELMMYKPDEILSGLSGFVTLYDGDIVMTGTPEGVGPVTAGDVFTGQVKKDNALIVSATWVAAGESGKQ